MVALVDDLGALGAVKRVKHPTDRRAHALSLTPKGQKLFESAFAVAISIEDRLCGNISGDDKKRLLELLGHLNSLTDSPEGVQPRAFGLVPARDVHPSRYRTPVTQPFPTIGECRRP